MKELGSTYRVGISDATSDLLRDNCDEFIYTKTSDARRIIRCPSMTPSPKRSGRLRAALDSLPPCVARTRT